LRTSPIRDILTGAGATMGERCGVEMALRFAGRRPEYEAVRNAAGLTDFSWMRAFSLPEEKGMDFLDALVAGNVPKIRFGRVLHTFLADADGFLAADCYVANNDKEFLFLCEPIVSDDAFDELVSKTGLETAGGVDLSPTHALIGLDGVRAWEVARKIFGADVLGLPYLSIENYTFEGQPVRLFRAGKTGEFGYLLLAPNAVAPALFAACKTGVEETGGGLCGAEVHNDLRLDGRFFNIHAEGRRARDPLVLGLQWMIDLEKTAFSGREAIMSRRSEGLRRKVVGVAVPPECEGLLQEGATLFHNGQPVGEVVARSFSWVLGQPLALALFPVELAYSGLTFRLGSADGPVARTLSMPPIMPKSLSVKLDEM